MKLRERVEGRARSLPEDEPSADTKQPAGSTDTSAATDADASIWGRSAPARPADEDALLIAKTHLADALDELSDVLGAQAASPEPRHLNARTWRST